MSSAGVAAAPLTTALYRDHYTDSTSGGRYVPVLAVGNDDGDASVLFDRYDARGTALAAQVTRVTDGRVAVRRALGGGIVTVFSGDNGDLYRNAAGTTYVGSNDTADRPLVRFNADLTSDTAFGDDGVAAWPGANRAAPDDAGRLLALTFAYGRGATALTRYA